MNFAQLSAFQRMEMQQLGLNPLREDHIEKYMKGGKGSIKENQERLLGIMGSDINRPIGHADDRSAVGVGNDGSFRPTVSSDANIDLRASLSRDMDNYAESTGEMSSGGLQSLREAAPRQQAQPQGKLTAQEVTNKGTQLATNYYNAFISSLKNPSSQANMKVFQHLKALLEYEQKTLASSQKGKQLFQESVSKITSQMYNQIKG